MRILLSTAAAKVTPYHRFLIIGAGPGGLQLAHYLHSALRDYAVLEQGDSSSGSFAALPRFRQLISLNKRASQRTQLDLAMRVDWNSLLTDQSHHVPLRATSFTSSRKTP